MHWALVNAFSQFNSNLLSVNTSSENLKMRWKYILTMHIRQKGGRWNAFDSQMELKCFQSEKLGGSRSRSQTNLFCASHSMDRRRLYFMRAIKLSKICQRIVFLAICCSHWLKSIFFVSFWIEHSNAPICLILILGRKLWFDGNDRGCENMRYITPLPAHRSLINQLTSKNANTFSHLQYISIYLPCLLLTFIVGLNI